MRRELIILIVLFSVFMAIGCTGNRGNETQIPATPVETPSTPVEEPATPVEGATTVTPATVTDSNVTSEAGSEGKIVEVSIKDFSFNPESVTVSTGDTVRWTNMDSASHTVSGPTFESGILKNGDSFEFLFTDPGVYDYSCSIHPSMKGTVIVENK